MSADYIPPPTFVLDANCLLQIADKHVFSFLNPYKGSFITTHMSLELTRRNHPKAETLTSLEKIVNVETFSAEDFKPFFQALQNEGFSIQDTSVMYLSLLKNAILVTDEQLISIHSRKLKITSYSFSEFLESLKNEKHLLTQG